MLCDRVANATLDDVAPTGLVQDAATRHWLLEGFTGLRSRVIRAKKFILSPEVHAAARAVHMGRPSSVEAAREFMRLPFAETWFEWQPVTGPLRPGAHAPSRVGMLIVGHDLPPKVARDPERLRSGAIHLFWYLPLPFDQVRLSAAALLFDFERKLIPQIYQAYGGSVPDPSGITAEAIAEGWQQRPSWLADPKELEAIRGRVSEIMAVPSPFVLGSLRDQLSMAQIQALIDKAMSDWEGEFSFFKSLLILLQCKNAVESRASEPIKASHARTRTQAGKLPLFEHHTIHLKLRGPERHGEPGAGQHASPRAHLVRAHFKTRRTGVFFWSPFVRGDAGLGTVRSRYKVEP